ncbi:D-alanyl-D-alanine carboxypeptidase [Cohnella nanjingensis]|uniref:D-alanyl-D-alanine carboxypeptidase n=2 Tax=Cohnella nanjingensis TaxID=1387779 RepID=A0A7X0RTL0_9BACL|nr:D-alanyl-D-alanine carboxypeptidase [Cohnella nanjingensis]
MLLGVLAVALGFGWLIAERPGSQPEPKGRAEATATATPTATASKPEPAGSPEATPTSTGSEPEGSAKPTDEAAITGTVAAKSAAMLDVETGKWLFAQNADKPLPPASMTKLMTETLILEDISSGRMKWDDKVEIGHYAANVVGSGMGLTKGQRVTVKTLFRGMAVHSANDATVALAEYAAGDERKFVERMNAKAKKIGLSKRTRFANATGLSSADLTAFSAAASEGETVMTAKDVAKLAKYMVQHVPDILDFTRESEAKGYGTKTALRNSNEMLPGQRFATAGNEGLKTGYTAAAGYCFTGSFRLNGHRYITVVMGTATLEARFEETRALLALGLGEEKRAE